MSLPQSNQPVPVLKSTLPGALIFIGGALTVVGALVSFIRNDGKEFGFSWLLAWICLSRRIITDSAWYSARARSRWKKLPPFMPR